MPKEGADPTSLPAGSMSPKVTTVVTYHSSQRVEKERTIFESISKTQRHSNSYC